MRKESSTVQKCKRQMATLGFDSQLAYHRVKLILKIYRDVVWVLSERVEELHEYAWELGAQDADTGLIYLQSFAPDIYYADLRPVIGSEQGGIRPVLILQNNVGNRHSPTVIAAPITSKMGKPRLPTHVCLNRQANGLSCGSVILLEQLRTIDKSRLRERVGALDTSEMKQIDWALGVSVGLAEGYR